MYTEVLNVKINEIFFPNFILSKNTVLNTNKNKYCKFLKILYYFQYKSTNILILILINKAINKKFRLFECSQPQGIQFLLSLIIHYFNELLSLWWMLLLN